MYFHRLLSHTGGTYDKTVRSSVECSALSGTVHLMRRYGRQAPTQGIQFSAIWLNRRLFRIWQVIIDSQAMGKDAVFHILIFLAITQ